MLRMQTILADATMPESALKTYAGYTDDELSQGKPTVRVQ
jgi:hypothetical protein